jgi:hypothetical protein
MNITSGRTLPALLRPRLANRAFPLLATVGLIAIGMAGSLWWGPAIEGRGGWQQPDDLWGTMLAAQRLLHLHLGALYTRPTGMVAFPGAAVILLPIVALVDAAGLTMATPALHLQHPSAWLAVGPYETALCGTALFAADAIAERLGASRSKRLVLAAVGAVVAWNVSSWGHPEDAVAVALLLYGVLALADAKTGTSAWLVGAAIAVQPLVLLAVPFILVVVERRRLVSYLARAAAPAAVLLGATLAANPSATMAAVGNQPNWPSVDHQTPFLSLAPHLDGGSVAAGPARVIAVLLACGFAVLLERRWRGVERRTLWTPQRLQELLWWIAVALALRCIFESVMVAFYVWPVLAVTLVTAVRHWPPLLVTSVLAVAIAFVSQLALPGRWTWWETMAAGLALVLVAARGHHPQERDSQAGHGDDEHQHVNLNLPVVASDSR